MNPTFPNTVRADQPAGSYCVASSAQDAASHAPPLSQSTGSFVPLRSDKSFSKRFPFIPSATRPSAASTTPTTQSSFGSASPPPTKPVFGPIVGDHALPAIEAWLHGKEEQHEEKLDEVHQKYKDAIEQLIEVNAQVRCDKEIREGYLQDRITEGTNAIAEVELEKKAITEELVSVHKSLRWSERTNIELEDKISNLEEQGRYADALIKEMQQDKTEAEEMVGANDTIISSQQGTITKLEQQVEAYGRQFTEAQNFNTSLQNKITALTKERDDFSHEADDKLSELDEAQTEVDHLNEEMDALQEELHSVKAGLEADKSNNARNAAAIGNEIQRLQKLNTDREAEARTMGSEIERLQKQLQDWNAEALVFKEKKDEESADLLSQLKLAHETPVHKNKQINEHRAQLTHIQDLVGEETIGQETASPRQELATAQEVSGQEIVRLLEELATVREAADKEIQQRDKQLTSMRDATSDAMRSDELARLGIEVRRLDEELVSAEEFALGEEKEFVSAQESARKEKEELGSAQESHRREIRRRKEQLAAGEHHSNALQARYDEKNGKIDELNDALNAVKKERDGALARLSSSVQSNPGTPVGKPITDLASELKDLDEDEYEISPLASPKHGVFQPQQQENGSIILISDLEPIIQGESRANLSPSKVDAVDRIFKRRKLLLTETAMSSPPTRPSSPNVSKPSYSDGETQTRPFDPEGKKIDVFTVDRITRNDLYRLATNSVPADDPNMSHGSQISFLEILEVFLAARTSNFFAIQHIKDIAAGRPVESPEPKNYTTVLNEMIKYARSSVKSSAKSSAKSGDWKNNTHDHGAHMGRRPSPEDQSVQADDTTITTITTPHPAHPNLSLSGIIGTVATSPISTSAPSPPVESVYSVNLSGVGREHINHIDEYGVVDKIQYYPIRFLGFSQWLFAFIRSQPVPAFSGLLCLLFLAWAGADVVEVWMRRSMWLEGNEFTRLSVISLRNAGLEGCLGRLNGDSIEGWRFAVEEVMGFEWGVLG